MPSCHAPVMKRSRQLPRLSGWCTDAPLTRLLPASVFLRGEEIGPSRPFAVNTLSRVRRCIRLPGNEAGRDFVVGDLHGHRELLERQLEQMGFNTHFDRLFSVGDLIDRGPHSLATLALIEEPWFHAVLGNHELRLLHHLGYYRSRLHAGRDFSNGGGAWIVAALDQHRRLVQRLADRVALLPMALHVDAAVPFIITHGDLLPIGSNQTQLLRSDTISIHKAEAVTASRDNLSRAFKSPHTRRVFEQHPVHLTDEPLGSLPLTYVGHSPVRQITVHNSYVYIEQGVSRLPRPGGTSAALTLLEHERFSTWLSAAKPQPAPRRQLSSQCLPPAMQAPTCAG